MQKKFEDNYHQKAVTRNENTYILVFQLLSQMDLVYKVPNSIHNTFHEIPSFFQSNLEIVSYAQIRCTLEWNNCAVNCKCRNGILLPKLFWPTVRKNCSSDREKLLKFEAEGQEFSKFLGSLEQFIQTVKGQNNFW